jgi:hypothetical protein
MNKIKRWSNKTLRTLREHKITIGFANKFYLIILDGYLNVLFFTVLFISTSYTIAKKENFLLYFQENTSRLSPLAQGRGLKLSL